MRTSLGINMWISLSNNFSLAKLDNTRGFVQSKFFQIDIISADNFCLASPEKHTRLCIYSKTKGYTWAVMVPGVARHLWPVTTTTADLGREADDWSASAGHDQTKHNCFARSRRAAAQKPRLQNGNNIHSFSEFFALILMRLRIGVQVSCTSGVTVI
jgi:hypothetical protein